MHVSKIQKCDISPTRTSLSPLVTTTCHIEPYCSSPVQRDVLFKQPTGNVSQNWLTVKDMLKSRNAKVKK